MGKFSFINLCLWFLFLSCIIIIIIIGLYLFIFSLIDKKCKSDFYYICMKLWWKKYTKKLKTHAVFSIRLALKQMSFYLFIVRGEEAWLVGWAVRFGGRVYTFVTGTNSVL